MDELQRQFLDDAKQIIEKLSEDVAELRQVRAQGPRRRELAGRIFRHVHNLKGAARAFELEGVARIAHEFETVLDGVRLGRINLTDDVVELFELATDSLAQALSTTGKKKQPRSITTVTERLAGLAAQSKNQAFIADSLRAGLPPDIAVALSEYDLQHAREAIREGAKLFIVSARFASDDFDEGFRQLTRMLGESGEIIATVPSSPSTSDEIHFRLLYAAEIVRPDILKRAASLGQIEVSELAIATRAGPSATKEPKPPVFQVEARPVSSVQVSLRQIDELVSALRDLFRKTGAAVVSVADPVNRNAADTAVASLQRQFSTLEETLIKLRLIPCAELLQRAAVRSGRAARQVGKAVDFEIEGGDVGIDQSLADLIVDPLLHLVRNAITHGIEDPEERITADKNPTGRIQLKAASKGSRVHITISDDGGGIDMARIAAAACEQGIVKQPEDLAPDQCLRLIFRPGFSTSTEVSEMSGRGIGLEIVDRAMELAGGEVRLATELGKGTTFVMMLPVSLALLPCVIVKSDDQFYGIASGRVTGMRSLDAPDLAVAENENTLDWDGESVPVIFLRNLLQAETNVYPSTASAILWQSARAVPSNGDGNKRFALVVDAIAGQHETLVRGLGRHAARWPGVSGASELWDGNVALVLDLEQLIEAQVTLEK